MNFLGWWVFPSLVIFIILLQLRRISSELYTEKGASKVLLICGSIIWPLGIILIIVEIVTLILMYSTKTQKGDEMLDEYVVQIQKGSKIYQDRCFAEWPVCKPPASEYSDAEYQYKTTEPDALFIATKLNTEPPQWECRRPGYGMRYWKMEESDNYYGNGAIQAVDVKVIGLNYKARK